MMKILVIGNMGYVGPAVVRELSLKHPDAVLHGYDNAYFAHCLTGADSFPERYLARQYLGDVRHLPEGMLEGYTAVVQLAAISNDPMGSRFAEVTREVNQEASIRIARQAAREGVRQFVFASSCSVYGVASGEPRKETDPLSPMTAYAMSKIGTEEALADLPGDMVITNLRFATACGMSARLRLDLVLNDFVACALSQRKITVLSDGTPWRPIVHVEDISRAFIAGLENTSSSRDRELGLTRALVVPHYQVFLQPGNETFQRLGGTVAGGVPVPMIVFAVCAVLLHLFLSRTVLGRFIYAHGDNAQAARLSGIATRPLTMVEYGLCAAIGYVGGVVMVASTSMIHLQIAESTMIFDVILVVVLGGVSLVGGRGNVLSVVAGTLLIGVLLNAMTIMNLDIQTQNIIKGAVLLVAIVFDSYVHPRDEETAKQGD